MGGMSADSPSARLLQAARAGDTQAIAALFAPHLPMLHAYCRAICGDHHAAEDAVQDTLLIAHEHRDRLFPEIDIAGWLRAIARRRALMAGRSRRRLTAFAEGMVQQVYEDDGGSGERERELRALDACLARLGERARSLIRATYFAGQPVADVARTAAMTETAVRTALHRAREVLGECLRRVLREAP